MVIKKFNCLELAQKIMQVGVDVTYMHTNFGGRDPSGFGDIATFLLHSHYAQVVRTVNIMLN